MFVRASLLMREEEKNQLDANEWFIALIICSICFGHFCAHHQELETICVLLPPTVCSAWLLVVGSQVQAAGYVSRKRDVARMAWPVVQYPSSFRPRWRNVVQIL